VMTPIPEAAPQSKLARGLGQIAAAVLRCGALADGFGEETAVSGQLAFAVNSVAEVDGFAAEEGVVPAWTAPWTYSATKAEGAATVTVSFSVDPRTAMATSATIDAFLAMAANNGPRCAA